MNLLKYMQIPYRLNGRGWDGADCYGLVILAFREERGIELFDPGRISDWRRLNDSNDFLDGAKLEWRKVERHEVKLFDVALIRRLGSKTPNHCGLVIDPAQFIELTDPAGVHVSRIDRWVGDIHAFYRHKELIAYAG